MPSLIRSAVQVKNICSLEGAGSGLASRAKFVAYVAEACPHCKELAPTWAEATQKWSLEHGQGLSWEKKQCLDDQWKPGLDYPECQAENIQSYPTLKFFPSESS